MMLDSIDGESLYQNRGALEESLLNTSKLLESLDKNNRFDDVGEYNYLLSGMEGLLGQFSENHHELHHEIKEIMESSRMGLLTHEKLVEMVTAEQLRSQYLSNIVGSLKDQIENLFTTILSAVDSRSSNDPEELLDKVSSNVNLMWKSVESMSKVISSPTKRLDQTIRKIDSEVVVHLSKSVQQNDGKKEGFAERLDKRLQKARVNEEKRRAKQVESDSDSAPNTSRVERSSRRGQNEMKSYSRQPVSDDMSVSSQRRGENKDGTSPSNRRQRTGANNSSSPVKGNSDASFQSIADNTQKPGDGDNNKQAVSSNNNAENGDAGGAQPPNKWTTTFDDNSSLGAGSLGGDSLEGNESIDGDLTGRVSEAGSQKHHSHHHKKHHHKKSRKERKSLDGEPGRAVGDSGGAGVGSSRRPSFDDASSDVSRNSSRVNTTSNNTTSNNNNNASSKLLPTGLRTARSGDNSKTARSNPDDEKLNLLSSREVQAQLAEERQKWEKERNEWQRSFEAKSQVEVQRSIYRAIIPLLDLHNIDSSEYQKILHSLTAESDAGRWTSIASQLSAQQQQQQVLSASRLNTNNNNNSSNNNNNNLALNTSSTTSSSALANNNTNINYNDGATAAAFAFAASLDPQVFSDPVASASLKELSQQWSAMDAGQRELLLALSASLVHHQKDGHTASHSSSSGLLQQLSSVIDQDRLVQFLQEQLSHWSGGALPSQHHNNHNSDPSRRGRSLDRKPSSLNRQNSSSRHLGGGGGGHSRSPSSVDRHLGRSRDTNEDLHHSHNNNRRDEDDEDAWSLDSHGRPMKRSLKKNSKKQQQSSPLLSKQHLMNKDKRKGNDGQAHGLSIQGKKTQKPMTQFLDEQAYHIGQLVRNHLQREGIYDAVYFGVVTDFIQQVLLNAAKSHGDSGLKHGVTDALSKNLSMIKISLPDKYKPTAADQPQGANSELTSSMVSAHNNNSNNNNNTAAAAAASGMNVTVKGNTVMTTTTMVKTTTTTTTISGAPVQQHEQQFTNLKNIQGPNSHNPNNNNHNNNSNNNNAHPNGWELPVYDNQENILITRTYRPPEKKEEFLALLQQNTDPLTFLYDEFRGYLPHQDRLRLQFACFKTGPRIEEQLTQEHNVHAPDRWVKTQELVADFTRSVVFLDDETKAMNVIMLDLEHIINEAVGIVKMARRDGRMRALDVSTRYENTTTTATASTSANNNPSTSHHMTSGSGNGSNNNNNNNNNNMNANHKSGKPMSATRNKLPVFDDDDDDEDDDELEDDMYEGDSRMDEVDLGEGGSSPKQQQRQTKRKNRLRSNRSTRRAIDVQASSKKWTESRDGNNCRYTIDDQNIHLMESHLFDIQRLLGEMEARVLSANLQQLEFRAFFQTLQAAGRLELHNMLREFTEIQASFVLSQEIQGRLYEIQQRLLLSHDRCGRYALFQYVPPQFAEHNRIMQSPSPSRAVSRQSQQRSTAPSMQTSHKSNMDHLFASLSAPSTSQQNHHNHNNVMQPHHLHHNQHDPQTAHLLRIIENLQEDIQVLEEEKEDVELELMEIVKSKDRAPDAILFFSLMHDPSFVPNLQQLCLQIKQVRGFLDYSVHMDYVMLRKRLQVCMVLAPNIEKLVEKYGLMYKQWAHYRRNWFAERNLRGGSAESFTTCPLCYHALVEGNNEVPPSGTAAAAGGAKHAQKLLQQSAHNTTIHSASSKQKKKERTSSATAEDSARLGKQHGRSAAVAAARQDETMLNQPPSSFSSTMMVTGHVSSSSSVNSNGSKKISHSISLPAIAPQR